MQHITLPVFHDDGWLAMREVLEVERVATRYSNTRFLILHPCESPARFGRIPVFVIAFHPEATQ
jgi:hypothetical protein